MKNSFKKYVKIILPAILLFFLFQTIFSNWQEVSNYIRNVEVASLLLSFLILLLIYPESAYAWFALTKKASIKISLNNALFIWIISNTSRYIPGSVWQYIGRVELGQKMGISRGEGIFVIFAETLLIVVSGLLIALFTVGIWSEVGIKPYMIALGLGIPLILLHPKIFTKILSTLSKLTKKEQITVPALKLYDYILVLPFFLANFLLNGLALTFLISAFTGNLAIERFFLFSGLYALSWLVGYFSFFAPGGIGVTEAVLAVLLSSYLPFPLASAIAICYRFLLVIAELLIFVFTLKIRRSKIQL